MTPLALGSDAWSQVIVALSIFGPLVLTAALVVWVIRGGRNDPDELRRRRVQAEHRARSQRPGAGATIDGPTQALRARSPELLRRRILQMLLAYDARDPAPDARDLQWSLAPYHDCARRLALDPIAFFDEVAAAGPSGFSAAVGAFGQRTDTAPDVFGGYALTESPDGPTYVWA